LLHLRQASLGAVFQQKAPRDTRSMLTQVALCTAARRAAFDHLIAVTGWTSHGYECHEPLLVADAVKSKSSVTSIPVHLHIENTTSPGYISLLSPRLI
jgi:hypothetical protein